MSNETSLRLQRLMDEIEWQLYTPTSEAGQKSALYERSLDMIGTLELHGV
ncbi:MAG: hypothetical protein IPI66_05070 [Chitinophagaceae bacterium]|nr:hypothetical protein [Chitinophagaceae bacterium]